MAKYVKNDIVIGTVTGIENYGIFVSLDDSYSGLIHISEISDKYVKNVCDYANLDEKIRVKVLYVDEESNHLKLSIKNFDYRINKKVKNNIEETSLGFLTLKEKLNDWIIKKKDELVTKNVNLK